MVVISNDNRRELDMPYQSTREVARLLGVTVSCLTRAVWDGRVEPPAKAPSGSYLWDEADIRRACSALLRRPLEAVLAERAAEGGGR